MMPSPAKVISATSMTLVLAACSAEVPSVKRETVIDDVEFAHILANPKKFDHVKVRVKGFARIEFEGNSLYSDLAAYNSRTWREAIWLQIGWPVPQAIEQLNGREVIVEGTFDASSKGHDGAFVGAIVGVDRLSPAR